jgi:hypothetical protein
MARPAREIAVFQVGIFLRWKYHRAKMTPNVRPPWKTPPDQASEKELAQGSEVVRDVAQEQDQLGADERDDDGVEGGVHDLVGVRPAFFAWT